MTDMDISANGLKFIADHEGFSEVVYDDVAGFPTIGYGHKITQSDNNLQNITTALALALLHKDVAHAVSCVNECVEVDINQNQFDSCVDLCYNIGGHAFQNSTLVKMMNNSQISDAADQFLRWDKAGSQEIQGLLNRRKDERELFLS